MPASTSGLSQLQNKVWAGCIPVEIRLASADCRTYDQADPYLINVPRLSYLPFLLPRLHAFFASLLIDPATAPHEAWLSFDNVPLKWHYPVGLLYDLHSGIQPATYDETTSGGVAVPWHGGSDDDSEGKVNDVLPWKLTLHYTEFPADQLIQMDEDYKVLLDSFINSVKEADFIRNGSAKVVMGMSKPDSDMLWRSVQAHNLKDFNTINQKFLNPQGGAPLRNVPIKLYLPSAPPAVTEDPIEEAPQTGRIRVVQSLVAPSSSSSRHPTTLGTALKAILPTVFPSTRNPVLAWPVMHGAVLPMAAPIEDLLRAASYADGFLHVAVIMLG